SAQGCVEVSGTLPSGGEIVVWVAEHGTQVLPVDMAVVREVDSDHVLELESRGPAACVSSVMHVSAYSRCGAPCRLPVCLGCRVGRRTPADREPAVGRGDQS